jgi:type IV pilus assembly protein PilW
MKGSRGFTMTELLVAMAITAVVMAAVFSTYKSQQDSYVVQEQVAETQQNLRAALYMMSRDIRMAGYDPTGKAKTGFVTDLPAPNNGKGAATTASKIAYTVDANGDGTIDNNDEEQAAYRLDTSDTNNVKLQKYEPGSTSWVTIAEYIDALNFVYLGAQPNGTTPPPVLDPVGTPSDLNKIRSVQVTLVARARGKSQDFTDKQSYENMQGTEILAPQNDTYRRRILSTTFQCRNMGL